MDPLQPTVSFWDIQATAFAEQGVPQSLLWRNARVGVIMRIPWRSAAEGWWISIYSLVDGQNWQCPWAYGIFRNLVILFHKIQSREFYMQIPRMYILMYSLRMRQIRKFPENSFVITMERPVVHVGFGRFIPFQKKFLIKIWCHRCLPHYSFLAVHIECHRTPAIFVF